MSLKLCLSVRCVQRGLGCSLEPKLVIKRCHHVGIIILDDKFTLTSSITWLLGSETGPFMFVVSTFHIGPQCIFNHLLPNSVYIDSNHKRYSTGQATWRKDKRKIVPCIILQECIIHVQYMCVPEIYVLRQKSWHYTQTGQQSVVWLEKQNLPHLTSSYQGLSLGCTKSWSCL